MGLDIFDHLDEIIEIVKLHLLPILLIFVVLMTNKHVRQTKYEQFAFYWFLFNGAVIAITWNGFVGGLYQCDPILRVYSLMDNRFKTKQNLVRILSLCDLFLHGPICLITARLFLNSRGIKRDTFAAFSSFLQAISTLFFILDEYTNNFINVCHDDSCFSFTGQNISFFWMWFVLFNLVSFLTSLYIINNSISNIFAQDKWTFANCAIENKTSDKYYSDFDKTDRPKPKKIKSS